MIDSPGKIEQLGDDLDYVRSVLQRTEEHGTIPSIYFLWAAVTLVGFALVDIKPEFAGAFWAIAGPLGGILSAVLGWRWSLRVGQASRRVGALHFIHWFGFMGAILLLVPMIARGELRGESISRVILLLVGLTYLLAGNYLERPLRWVALVVFGGYGLTFVLHACPWTAAGLAVAASLVLAGLLGTRRGRAKG
jgi:hypothetical protein